MPRFLSLCLKQRKEEMDAGLLSYDRIKDTCGLCPGVQNFWDFLSDREPFPTICKFRLRGESSGPLESFRIRAKNRATSLVTTRTGHNYQCLVIHQLSHRT